MRPAIRPLFPSLLALATGATALASITTTPTIDEDALANALNPQGLSIDSVWIKSGKPDQFGTYTNFVIPPVTIHSGVVLSSGNVAQMGPFPEAQDPKYNPCCPPEQISSEMTPWPETGGTPEFDAYGFSSGSIENFSGSFDVAALVVEFTLQEDSAVKFDFIFGSVEYPYWTSQFTDAFVVFLDGTTPDKQITFDPNGNAVQVGSSFAGLETIADGNTAFSDPHGLIHHLTTTTEQLSKGSHVLVFEVGDVNDHILDSAVFIADLRVGSGAPGTDPTEDCPADLNSDDAVDGADLAVILGSWGPFDQGDLNGDDITDGVDLAILLSAWGPCPS